MVIAAPHSNSGKTILTLGLIRAFGEKGLAVAPAKTGPDYIDTAFLSAVAHAEAINLDPWAMSGDRLGASASAQAVDTDLMLVEGVMGLFDGAADGSGSTGDLAAILGLPVILVVDASHQSQSIGALVSGFVNWRKNVRIGGIVLNKVGSDRHLLLLKNALAQTGIPVVGALPRIKDLQVPGRHLGLVLPGEIGRFEALASEAGKLVATHCDLDAILDLATPVERTPRRCSLAPLGQHIAIAKDAAFAFIYQHWLNDWRAQGAQISFFSPLGDQGPDESADAIFLPGGYPELHGEVLAGASGFIAGMHRAQSRGKLIYGECGGYMVLGQSLTDQQGVTHKMAGLLPHDTFMDRPRLVLGYRNLNHAAGLPWPRALRGHEFHYSSSGDHNARPLFTASDALGNELDPMGAVVGRVMGAYAHVIDQAGDVDVADVEAGADK